jgi:hypothetical protein
MALIEKTQFSIKDLESFLKAPPADPTQYTTRQLHMAAFGKSLAADHDWSAVGGVDNVARVRVLAEEKDGGTIIKYDLVPKLPPALAIERRAAKAREEKRAAIMAEVEKLRADPKALEKFIKDVVAVALGRGYALGLLKGLKPAPKAARKPPARKPLPKAGNTYSIPKKAIDDYSKAIEQDRRNRIEAAKKAAAEAKKVADAARKAS